MVEMAFQVITDPLHLVSPPRTELLLPLPRLLVMEHLVVGHQQRLLVLHSEHLPCHPQRVHMVLHRRYRHLHLQLRQMVFCQ